MAKYDVGYGKPPVHTRFRKGQSGNPRGRRPGSPNLKTILRELMEEEIPLATDARGRRKRVPAIVVILTRLRNEAIKGNMRAIDKLLDRVLPLLLQGEANAQDLTAEDYAILDDLVRKRAPGTSGDGGAR